MEPGNFEAWVDRLPKPDAPTVEERARAVLRLLADGACADLDVLAHSNLGCPNCGADVESQRSPYCSEVCKDVAAFVRQMRTGLASGAALDPERQTAMGQTLWHLLGGGRPLRRDLVPERARLQVLKREDGICQGCGGVATTTDHARTGCNRPINLRAVCATCCTDRDFYDSAVMQTPEFAERLGELVARVRTANPARACDDAATWDWRAFLARRSGNVRP